MYIHASRVILPFVEDDTVNVDVDVDSDIVVDVDGAKVAVLEGDSFPWK